MALSMKTLTPMAIAFFLILATANTAQSQTTSFTYDFGLGIPVGLSLLGDASLAPDTNYLRLTKTDNSSNALQGSTGQAIYQGHVAFWDSGKVSDFETTIKFIIRPNANDNSPPADGLTFFLAPTITNWPPVTAGGNFGIFGPDGTRPGYFVVEFDIYPNEWDPPHPHVGIDIESRVSAATTEVSKDLIGKEVTMRVNYVGATKMISAVVTSGSERYEVSYEYDLTTVLPQMVVVGISASTGANVAVHDVVSWYFTSTMYQQFSNRKSIRQVV